MLNQNIILSLCEEYQVGSIVDIQIAPAGIENLNYFIKTDDRGNSHSFVLTVIQSPSYSQELYFPMMDLLKKNGLPVPAPIADRKGNFFNVFENQKVILQPRLPGKHLLEPNNHDINQLVEIVAKLHKVPHKSIGLISAHPRDTAWINHQRDRLDKILNEHQKATINLALARVERLSASENKLDLNKALIHADLFRDNVLFNNQKMTGILDFHHASIGYCMYDLAVIAIDWCQEKDRKLHDDLLQRMLKTYNNIKPVTSDELKFFNSFMVFAALNFWLSRLIGQKENKDRVKEPQEMEDVLKHLIEH